MTRPADQIKLTTSQLQEALELSWSRETSSVPVDWSEAAKSRGQCVPTALVAQYYLGGDLQKLATTFNGYKESHYRNILHDGTIFDATRSQYPDGQELAIAEVDLAGFDSIREKRLSEIDVRHRYETLLRRVEKLLRIQ